MKILKFRPHLAQMILDGAKNITWRLFDDKDLSVGYELIFQNWETGEMFASAVAVEVAEKTLGNIKESDFTGHENFKNQDDMISQYKEYYGDKVNPQTTVKIIKFKLV